MTSIIITMVVVSLVLCLWLITSGKRLRARIARITRVRLHGGPDADIGYLSFRGVRTTRKISIESVQPSGGDWLITAWCHKKKDFFVFKASRIYWYFDLNKFEEIPDILGHFARRAKAEAKGPRPLTQHRVARV